MRSLTLTAFAIAWTSFPLTLEAAPKWIDGDLVHAKNEAKRNNQPILVLFHALNSKACERADQRVFGRPEFEEESKGWVLVRVDASLSKTIVEKYELSALPTSLFMRNDGQEIGRYIGARTVGEYVEAMSRARAIHELEGVDPTTLSDGDADRLMDALFSFELFPEVVSTVRPRVEAHNLKEQDARRARILLATALALIGEPDEAVLVLKEALKGVGVEKPPKQAEKALDFLLAFNLLGPTYVVPIAISTAENGLVGVIVSQGRLPDDIVLVVDQIEALAGGETPAGLTEGQVGALYLRAGNPEAAITHIKAAVAAGAPDEATDAFLALHLAAAEIVGGDPANALSLLDSFLTRHQESEHKALALCLAAIACKKSGEEVRYIHILDYLHEHFEDTVWYQFARDCRQILQSLDSAE